jgi:hypothetical protein
MLGHELMFRRIGQACTPALPGPKEEPGGQLLRFICATRSARGEQLRGPFQ